MSPAEKVVIVGAGHLGRLLFDCLDGDPRWDVVGFIDDGLAGSTCFDKPIFGADAYDPNLTPNAFMAIGFPSMRRMMYDRVASLGLRWCTFIDRRSMVGRQVILGQGVLVLSFAMISSGVTIGDFTYLSCYAHVGTGAKVGTFTSILGSASVGKCIVGNDCVIGLKSACLDGAKVGDGATLSPFTLLRKAVPAGSLAVGSPVRIFPRGASGGLGAGSDDANTQLANSRIDTAERAT